MSERSDTPGFDAGISLEGVAGESRVPVTEEMAERLAFYEHGRTEGHMDWARRALEVALNGHRGSEAHSAGSNFTEEFLVALRRVILYLVAMADADELDSLEGELYEHGEEAALEVLTAARREVEK